MLVSPVGLKKTINSRLVGNKERNSSLLSLALSLQLLPCRGVSVSLSPLASGLDHDHNLTSNQCLSFGSLFGFSLLVVFSDSLFRFSLLIVSFDSLFRFSLLIVSSDCLLVLSSDSLVWRHR